MVSKFLDVSAVDREDVEVSVRQDDGWIVITIRNAVGIPVPVVIDPREPISEKEIRARLNRKRHPTTPRK